MGGAIIATYCALFFKFLQITKLPLYMRYKIIHAPSNSGSTLDLAAFVLSRMWWQPNGGSRSATKPGLIRAILLKQWWDGDIAKGSHL